MVEARGRAGRENHPGAVGRKAAGRVDPTAQRMRGPYAAKEGGTAGPQGLVPPPELATRVPPEEICTVAFRVQIDLSALDHEVLRFWRENDVFARSLEQSARPAGVGVLRGAADRQRHARRPPHRGAGLQGRLPPFPDDEGLPRRPQGRLGLPRPAGRAGGREGARLLRQAGHREVRHRRVQRQVPGVGDPAHRRVRRAHRPHGLLGRPGRRVPDDGPGVHRVASGGR